MLNKTSRQLPATKISEAIYNDLHLVLAAKKFRKSDYIRLAIAEQLVRDKAHLASLGIRLGGGENGQPTPAA